MEATGTDTFTGKAWITVPYLGPMRIAVEFKDIQLNTDLQLMAGEVKTTYDPEWKNVLDINEAIGDVKEVAEAVSDVIEAFSDEEEEEITIYTPNEEKSNTNPETPKETASTPTNPPTNTSSGVATTPPKTGASGTATNGTTGTAPPNTGSIGSTNTEPTKPIKISFKPIELTATDKSNKNRVAKSGETLYFVNSLLRKKASTNFKLTIDPKLAKEQVKDDVHWFVEDKPIIKQNGLLSFSPTDLENGKNATIKVSAGNPDEKTKWVNVKWVDKNYSGNVIVKEFPFSKMIVKILDYSDFIKTYIPGVRTYNNRNAFLQDDAYKGFKYYIETKAERNSLNIEGGTIPEDPKPNGSNRLFYNRITTVGQVSIGIKWENEIPIPGLSFGFNNSYFGQVVKIEFGVFVKPSVNVSGELGITKREYEWVDKPSLNSSKTKVDPARLVLAGGLSIVPKGEVKLASVAGGFIGEAGVTAELLEYDFKDGYDNVKISYPLFQEGFKYSLEVKAYAEWSGYKYEHIFDKIEGEYEWKK